MGTYRGAAAISGTTPKMVKRVIARHESGGAAPVRRPREHNYDAVIALVAERVEKIDHDRSLAISAGPRCGRASPRWEAITSRQ